MDELQEKVDQLERQLREESTPMGQINSESEDLKEQLRRIQTETKPTQQGHAFYMLPQRKLERFRELPPKNMHLSIQNFVEDLKTQLATRNGMRKNKPLT